MRAEFVIYGCPTISAHCMSCLQELRNQERNEQDMVKIQQMALKRGTSSSGTGGSALPSTIQPLMQQPKS
jgi:hypothetical protein